MAELLSDRYELVHKVAEGPIAALWRGNLRSEAGFVRPVAVRVLREPWDRDPAVWSAWSSCASELARRASPHVEQWIDLVVLGKRGFIVTEWIDGLSVRRWIDAHAAEKRRVPWSMAASIAIEVLRGLASSPFWHGGIDAHSVRIARTGTVKLVRFGAALALGPVLDRQSLEEIGAQHPAPEIAAGGAPSASSDVFAVGTLLFEMIAGRSPFDAKAGDARDAQLIAGEIPDLSTLREDVPPLLVALIETALRSDPSTRFATPDAMIRGLAQLLRSATERSDATALAESVLAIVDRAKGPAESKPVGLPEQSTMHVELSEVTVMPTNAQTNVPQERAPYRFPHKERTAAQPSRSGLQPAPQHLSAQESEALPLLLTRRAKEGGPLLGIAPQKTEHIDAEELERMSIPDAPAKQPKLGVTAQRTEMLDADQLSELTLTEHDDE